MWLVGDIAYHFFSTDLHLGESYYFGYGGNTFEENQSIISDGAYHKLTEDSIDHQRAFAKAHLEELNMSHVISFNQFYGSIFRG